MNSAFLIDGGFFIHKLREFRSSVSSEDVMTLVKNVRAAHDASYRLLRIYYYDCAPSDAKTESPIQRIAVDYRATTQFRKQTEFLSALRRADYVSVREGRLIFRGWSLKKNRLFPAGGAPAPTAFNDTDFQPDFEQKGVDIKIGLDIAWLSMGGIAQRIYLVTGDSDFVPAMKFARRAGVQVYFLTLAHGVRDELKDHADVLVETPLKELLESGAKGLA
jgi:uncharacterized LabA/DUF88 family protein